VLGARWLCTSAAALACGVAAAPAGAAVTLGSSLSATATTNAAVCVPSCTYVEFGLPGRQVMAPFDGVITSWRMQSGSAGNPVALRVLRPTGGSTSFTGAGTSAAQMTVIGVSPPWAARLPIRRGDMLGVDNANQALMFNQVTPPGAVAFGWMPALADGATAPANVTSPGELLVQANLEPDADHDGFGDETQDACPTNPAAQTAPCPAPGAVGGGGGSQSAIALTVRPLKSQVARGHRLRLRVKVTGAVNLVAGDVTVTLTPRGGHGKTLRKSVIVAPDAAGARTATIGINVPRGARTGRYTLRGRLVDDNGTSAIVLARFTAAGAVRVTR
jgi:hypothetical protein